MSLEGSGKESLKLQAGNPFEYIQLQPPRYIYFKDDRGLEHVYNTSRVVSIRIGYEGDDGNIHVEVKTDIINEKNGFLHSVVHFMPASEIKRIKDALLPYDPIMQSL